MRSHATALALLCLCPSLGAAQPLEKQEAASAQLVLIRPADGGAFADPLRNFRQQADKDRPFEWKEVDERIDTWFAAAVSRFPEEHKKHAEQWEALREQSKRNARVTLAAVEQAWKNSIGKAAAAFEASETGFYASRPTLHVRGTYQYFEGQRDRSAIDPSWQLSNATADGFPQIRGADSYDSGEMVLNAAGMDLAMFSLRTTWDIFLEAAIDPDSLRATAVGAINTPSIKAWIAPRFDGKSNRKVTSTWRNYDKSSTPIGPIKLNIGDTRITVTMEVGSGFTYEALDPDVPMPVLNAGQDAAPRAD